jgi:hypothetical protein
MTVIESQDCKIANAAVCAQRKWKNKQKCYIKTNHKGAKKITNLNETRCRCRVYICMDVEIEVEVEVEVEARQTPRYLHSSSFPSARSQSFKDSRTTLN